MTAEFAQTGSAEGPEIRTFDYHVDKPRLLSRATNELDKSVKVLTSLVKTGEPVNQDYVDYFKDMAAETMIRARIRGGVNWVEYYRLAMSADFLEERALAPLLFNKAQLYNERKELANGVCGVAVERLAQLLGDYDRIQTVEELDELYGMAHEMTILAMLNRSQVPSRLAVPSSQLADKRRRTDLRLYHMVKSQAYVANVQVKSYKPEETIGIKPRNGFIVSGEETGNGRFRDKANRAPVGYRHETDLMVSRALVKLHEGLTLTNAETTRLNNAQQRLDEIIKERLVENPGASIKMH